MPVYRIYRLREAAQEHFRWAPHISGATPVKSKDYHEAGLIEASSVYSAWKRLGEAGTPLQVGDLLEAETGELRISKYVGFEEAHWLLPEPEPAARSPQDQGGTAAAGGPEAE